MTSRSNIPTLIQRLRSGSRVAQLQAVQQLAALAATSAGQCQAIIACGGIGPLVQSTASAFTAGQAAAVTAIYFLASRCPSSLGAMADAGAIPNLTTLLRNSSLATQALAANALALLAWGHAGRKAAVLAAGAVEPLVQMLRSEDCAVHTAAVAALSNLAAGSDRCSTAIAQAGAIPPLVRLVPVLPDHVLNALTALAVGSNARQEAVAAAGAGPALEQLLISESCSEAAKASVMATFERLSAVGPGSKAFQAVAAAAGTLVKCMASTSPMYQQNVLAAIARVAHGRPSSTAGLIAAGVLPHIDPYLHSSVADVAGNAAWLVSYLCNLPVQRETVGAAGFTAAMIRLLRHENANTQEGAAWALHRMALDCAANQQAILAAGGFEALLEVVQDNGGGSVHSTSSSDDSSGTAKVRGAAAMALCTLAQGSKQRMQATKAAGAAAAIQQGLLAWDLQDLVAGTVEAAHAALRFLEADDIERHTSRQTVPAVEAEAPALASAPPATRPPRVCAAPGCSTTTGLRRCGGCGTVRYCSAECSRAHWREHKGECRRLQAAKAEAAAAAAEGQQPARA